MPLGQQVRVQLEQVAEGDEAETGRKRMLPSRATQQLSLSFGFQTLACYENTDS